MVSVAVGGGGEDRDRKNGRETRLKDQRMPP